MAGRTDPRSGLIQIFATGVEARQCGGSRHFRRTPSAPPPHPLRTPSAPGFPKEQLKLSSGGGVAIITFSNETFQDNSGNPIAITPFKGAHMIAVTLTESGMICINIILAIML